ncbi:MAG: DUF2059 domain-containing protein [Planctomycetota bacterium]|jgi:hypothetical protein
MKKLTVLVLALVVTVGGMVFGQAADDKAAAGAAFKEDVLKLIATTGEAEMAVKQMNDALPMLKMQQPDLPPQYWDKFQEKFTVERYTGILAPVYQKYYTHDDIKGLLEFYETDLGKKIAQTQPKVMQEVAQASMQLGMQVSMEIMMELQKESAGAQPQQPFDAQ